MKITDEIIRVDARKKIRGENKYTEDLKIANLHFAKTLRSKIAKGRIISRTYPELPEGVYIIDYQTLPGPNVVAIVEKDLPIFAEKEINYYGEPLALVVGKDKDLVLKYLNKIKIETEILPGIFSITESKQQNGKNYFDSYSFTKGDLAQLKTDKIFEKEYHTGYQEQLYLEKQGLIADFNAGVLTVTGSMQCPYYIKNALVFGTNLPEDKVIVKQAEVGGAFGGKEEYPSYLALQAAAATMKIGAPVRLIPDRLEDLMYTTKRHPSEIRIKSYLIDQKIAGMEIDVDLDCGSYLGLSNVVLQRALLTLTGAYNIENLRITGTTWKTNNPFSGAFRGFGAPQTMFALEQHMNQVARFLKIDPLEFRKPYLVKQGDYSATSGRFLEKIELVKMVKKLEDISDYHKKAKIVKNESGKLYGIGISIIPHGGGFTGDGEAAHIKAVIKLKKKNDQIYILIASTEMGQGAKTALAKIVASVLEIDLEQVIYENPDTSKVPDSGPTVASRTTMVVGGLLYKAALKMKERFSEAEFEIEEKFVLPDGVKWDQAKLYGNAYMAYSWSCLAAEVEIDPVTYEVDVLRIHGIYDAGQPVDTKLLTGQINGGIIQGLGYALTEKMEVNQGVVLQNNMADYAIPTALDIPELNIDWIINKYADGPFGAKGIGELTLVGVAPAIASAIENALDKDVTFIPVTPESIMELVENES